MLSIRNARIHYGLFEAVRGISMEIPRGCITSLLGANGSGKSTIFKAISGLKQITSGEICLENQRIDKVPAHRRVTLGLAHVPEGKGLFPFMSVIENLWMGAYLRNNKAEIRQDIEEIFDLFPALREGRNKQARLLSGGQQETLSISRALMTRPKLLLLDEPLQGISPLVQEEIMMIIMDLNKRRNLTTFIIEHNVNMALSMSQNIYILDSGKVLSHGTPQDLTKTEYILSLIHI